jgi:hypothetical protein
MALTGLSKDDRQMAVIALTRAHTPEAMAALSDLRDQIAQLQNAAQTKAQPQPSNTTSPPPPLPNSPPAGQGKH